MRRIVLVLIAVGMLAPFAGGSNCPANPVHCQLLVEIGDEDRVVAEFGVVAETELQTVAAIFPVAPGASVHIWANVSLTSNSTGQSANLTISFQDTAGVAFPSGANRSVVATQAPQNLTVPIELDPDIVAGDVVAIPVLLLHEDGSRASTHIPIQVGSIAGHRGTETWIDGLMDWWWALALALILGAAIGLALGRTSSR